MKEKYELVRAEDFFKSPEEFNAEVERLVAKVLDEIGDTWIDKIRCLESEVSSLAGCVSVLQETVNILSSKIN